jgi:hypothetical protein
VHAHVQTARFLISQQRYLEALETQQKFEAMVILQQDIAPVDIERDRLNHLSRYLNEYFEGDDDIDDPREV